jgi:hypothetical protein
VSEKLESHLTSYVRPCGTSKRFEVYVENGMNHRELLAMWRELELHAKGYQQLLKTVVERQDAHNYSI